MSTLLLSSFKFCIRKQPGTIPFFAEGETRTVIHIMRNESQRKHSIFWYISLRQQKKIICLTPNDNQIIVFFNRARDYSLTRKILFNKNEQIVPTSELALHRRHVQTPFLQHSLKKLHLNSHVFSRKARWLQGFHRRWLQGFHLPFSLPAVREKQAGLPPRRQWAK